MAYLIRRLLENTSNESFLKQTFVDKVDQEKLLESPVTTLERSRQQTAESDSTLADTGTFKNEPVAPESAGRRLRTIPCNPLIEESHGPARRALLAY